MNYTEKVNNQVKAILEPFEEKLIEAVKKLVLESFKNGIEVGKQGKTRKGKEPEQNNQEKDE
jgi:hypothetical protein